MHKLIEALLSYSLKFSSAFLTAICVSGLSVNSKSFLHCFCLFFFLGHCPLKQTVVRFGLFRCHNCNSNSVTPQFYDHALSQVLLFCRPSCFCHLSNAWKRQQHFEF